MKPDLDRWMGLALAAARRSTPSPNPPVGAALVSEERLVAIGWHERAGGPHAEIVALRAAGPHARGATLYVTLEPCNHYGKTPPCVDALAAAGLTRVVIGCKDPNSQVVGAGAERLRGLGVEVVLGVRAEEARELISPWVKTCSGEPRTTTRGP